MRSILLLCILLRAIRRVCICLLFVELQDPRPPLARPAHWFRIDRDRLRYGPIQWQCAVAAKGIYTDCHLVDDSIHIHCHRVRSPFQVFDEHKRSTDPLSGDYHASGDRIG